jgi:hypothetical protein
VPKIWPIIRHYRVHANVQCRCCGINLIAITKLRSAQKRQGQPIIQMGSGFSVFLAGSKSKAEFDNIVKLKRPWTLHVLCRTVRFNYSQWDQLSENQ